jgi:hypothetical protein
MCPPGIPAIDLDIWADEVLADPHGLAHLPVRVIAV